MEFSTPREAPPIDIHAPFTRAERMDQLAEIDRVRLIGTPLLRPPGQSHLTRASLKDIASLLELSGKAIQSLGKQDPTKHTNTNNGNGNGNGNTSTLQTDGQPEPPQPLTTEEQTQEQTQSFQDNMAKFLTTLHSVDVRLKRQIFGLEESGILTLGDKDAGPGPAQRPILEPNGLGLVGNLDVGWLNSRSNQVEREMEAELWTAARGHLEHVAGPGSGGRGGGDTNMTG